MLGTAEWPGVRNVGLRPATMADVDALCAMHRRCSQDSLYRRYLMSTNEVGPASMRRLLTDTTTTVVEAADGQLVGMGNVCLGAPDAEAALLVEDGWQRRGLGVCLACLIAGQALVVCTRRLTATVLASNLAICRTLTAAGLAPVIVDADAGTLELHCALLWWARPQLVPRPRSAPAVDSDPAAADAVGPPTAAGLVDDRRCDLGRLVRFGCPLARVPAGPLSLDEWPADGPQPTLTPAGVNAPGVPVQEADGRRVMTTMVVDSAKDSAAAAMTVGRLRDLFDDLADDTPLHIGVYGHQHFNTVLGTMPVTSARVEPILSGVIVLLYVPGIS